MIDRIRKAYPPDIDIDEWNGAVVCLLEAFRQVDGWFSTENCVDLFEAVVNSCPPGGTVVEVGSWKGRSGVVCSHAAALRRGRLFCVDHWRGNETEGSVHISVRMAREANIFAIFEDNMRRYARQNYRVLRGDSAQIGKNWPEECPIDVFFLDAGHDFHSVLADLQSWVPHVRPGGLVCGDDWNHDERDDLGGSVRRAFQVHFGCTHPNLGISGRFWRHRLSAC